MHLWGALERVSLKEARGWLQSEPREPLAPSTDLMFQKMTWPRKPGELHGMRVLAVIRITSASKC